MDTVWIDHPQEGVTRITLNRPERLNALNATLVAELHEALAAIGSDRTCRVVVLTGAGRGFCAGLDLSGYGEPPGLSAQGPHTGHLCNPDSHRLARATAARTPPAGHLSRQWAGGRWWAGSRSGERCPIAAASARFNVAFVKLGISGCDIGVSWLLPRLIGASRAWELMLTGRLIDADEADRIGLVLKVVDDEELPSAALETASLIVANSPWGVRMTKEVMWSQLEVGSLQAGIDLENRTQVLSSGTSEMQEAISAFLEKRVANFKSDG